MLTILQIHDENDWDIGDQLQQCWSEHLHEHWGEQSDGDCSGGWRVDLYKNTGRGLAANLHTNTSSAYRHTRGAVNANESYEFILRKPNKSKTPHPSC